MQIYKWQQGMCRMFLHKRTELLKIVEKLGFQMWTMAVVRKNRSQTLFLREIIWVLRNYIGKIGKKRLPLFQFEGDFDIIVELEGVRMLLKTLKRKSYFILVLAITISISGLTQSSDAKVIPNAYIVQVADTADVHEVASKAARFTGGSIGYVYSKALWGFSIRVPPGITKAQILAQPGVVLVEPDLEVTICAQTLPTGVNRIDVDLNNTAKIDGIDERVDVDIAIIDTGIDIDHPDLYVVGGRHFYTVGNRSRQDDKYDDNNGHGSHVAGTAAALDNDIGAVGVAPGARLWAVKVLDASGSGYLSDVIAGVDWVTERANQIEVVNMSLSATGTSSAFRTAIQNSVAAGVVYVVAAGNDAKNVYGSDDTFNTSDDIIPAAYPEVATISAMADSDGQPGGAGGSTGYGSDDSFATFSNFSRSVVAGNPVTSPGAAIDLLMPGVNIYSTWKNGGYNTISGTSMASPHAAGLAALYIAINGRATNAAGVYAIRQALIDNGVAQDSTQGLAQLNDPDAHWERIGWAGPRAVPDTNPPTPNPMTWATPPYATGTISIAMVATTAFDLSGMEYYFACTAGGGHDSGWQASTIYEDTGLTPGTQYTYTVTARDKSVNQNATAPSTAESATTLGIYIISGNAGVAGATMNGLPRTPVSDANGDYSDTVDWGWSGTVTPVKAGYTFSPASIVYNNVTSDQLNQDYTASLLTYTISGTVTYGGSGLSGVVMSGLPGNPVTSGGGNYTVAVDYGWSGTITPSKDGYTFTPASRIYTSVAEDHVGDNYIATLNTYTISGHILEPDGNTPVEGVVVDANNNGGSTDTTDANGYYEVVVPYDWSGTATPTKEGYTFEPNSIWYNNVVADEVNNYTATLLTFAISGYILEFDEVTPISDVNVVAENGGGPYTSRYGGGSDTADANGCYEVVVDYNWSGEVTPTKYAYGFEPKSRAYTNVIADQNDQDYTGKLLTFAISGCIRNDCNVPIKDVVVTATHGGSSTATDANGHYEVWVDYNWSGTVTPSKAYYTFAPNFVTYTAVLEDKINQSYLAANIYDLDCNGSIDFSDVHIISVNWLDDTVGNICDFNADGIVNLKDYAEFADVWATEYGE
jgi:subtilisin family serine protease